MEISQIIIFVVEALKFTSEDEKILSIIKRLNFKTILVINKIDLLEKNIDLLLPFINVLKSKYKYHGIIPFVAKKIHMIQSLKKIIKEILPETDFLFKKNQVSNKKKIFFFKEIIREKILKMYQDEIPYSVSLDIEDVRVDKNSLIIHTNLYVKNEYHKKIIIGKKGEKIKKLIQISSQSIENYIKKKIILNLNIKIKNEI